jgi:tetratricopeptide (TPR) repeat protein
MKNQSLVPDTAKDNMYFVFAQDARIKQSWGNVQKFASKVSEKSEKYGDAQYLYGISLYSQGKRRQAEKSLESLQEWMAKTGKEDRNLMALTAVNLGRIKFKAERYEAAHLDYKKVPKDHPLWVDALIEQGWAQLNTGDSAGAIGNMYSLHSPYFQSVYMPESWVVRTIGYLNICQYGDAYRTLTKLEKMHSSHARSIDTYLKKTKSHGRYYSTVKNYLQGASNKSVDGLPAQVIREVARHRGFLNVQNTINEKVDEIGQYDFIYGLLNKDIRSLKARKAASLKRRNEAKANLVKMKTDKKLKPREAEFRSVVRAESSHMRRLAFEIGIHNISKKGFRNLRAVAQKRLNREKNKLRYVAGAKVKDQLRTMRKQIRQILEGNEFLRYEIFAGSGEDIRYQAAGGKTVATNRIPASVKPQKILNWEFDGEYWEDEIGNYRSTLRNNCPDRARSVVGR